MTASTPTISERIDRAIFQVFPSWGAARIERRRRHAIAMSVAEKARQQFARAYEASDSDRFRGTKWMTSKLSPNSELDTELETLVTRAKDLYRNDSYAASACNGRVDNVVGCGIRLQSRIRESDDMEADRADDLVKQLEDVFRRWQHHERLFDVQRQYELCRAIYGEAFAVFSDVGLADKPVPLSVQVIAPERVETPPEQESNPRVRLGIETDQHGRPVAYYIRRSHPYETHNFDLKYDRVPANRVAHSFERLFPGQSRGVPWLTPAMADLKDLKDFKEANLIAEQVAACFAAFVKTNNPAGAAAGAASETTSDGARIEELYPGAVEYLGEDEDITFSSPNRPGTTLAPYMEWHLRSVAAALRYPYELLVKHFSNNFSGGRLALIDGRITFRCWQQQHIRDFLTPLWNRFVDECVMVGAIDVEPDEYVADPWLFRVHAWVPPGWPWVDPVKDVQSDVLAVTNNLGTESDSLAARGLDLEETKEQRKREKILDLEVQAAVERRRRELASEFEDDGFGMEPDQQPVAVGASDNGVREDEDGDE